MPVKILDTAKRDILEAHAYYVDQESMALGRSFRAEVKAALHRIEEFPEAWPRALGYRRCIIKRFPYCIFYEVESEHIVVVAVSHHKRRPGYWRGNP